MDGQQPSQPPEGGWQQGQRGQRQQDEGEAGRGQGRGTGHDGGFWAMPGPPLLGVPSRSSSVHLGSSGRYEGGRVGVELQLKGA